MTIQRGSAGRVKRNPSIMFVIDDLFSKIIVQADTTTPIRRIYPASRVLMKC